MPRKIFKARLSEPEQDILYDLNDEFTSFVGNYQYTNPDIVLPEVEVYP